MQRRAYAPAAALTAAALAAALTACGGSGSAGPGDDAKPGRPGASAPAAQPGKYRSLPEPCRYVNRDTLRRMLPLGQDDSTPDAEQIYQGTPAITYDTDRRVGCHWKLETPEGTRSLSVDFERVVSYQAGVSDEERAGRLYERRASAAHIPGPSASPSGTSATPGSSGSPASGSSPAPGSPGASDGPRPQGSGSPSPLPSTSTSPGPSTSASGSPSATPSAAPSASASLAPRTLDDLGEDAFIDDKLVTAGSGVHRGISVVFRDANILVTVAYDQWSADKQHIPGSADLQGKAHGLARELDAGHFGN
ncbi:hypothetical protein ACFP1Z_17510 [Streptomyces gamaensis]|uniref:DUF3558 domain-containing protein n=1 Tax=Streptomyces gamaensis TaxID=1763542 RepID=A0ABW0YZE2_9ACTN